MALVLPPHFHVTKPSLLRKTMLIRNNKIIKGKFRRLTNTSEQQAAHGVLYGVTLGKVEHLHVEDYHLAQQYTIIKPYWGAVHIDKAWLQSVRLEAFPLRSSAHW